jgi:hypothetical protein
MKLCRAARRRTTRQRGGCGRKACAWQGCRTRGGFVGRADVCYSLLVVERGTLQFVGQYAVLAAHRARNRF